MDPRRVKCGRGIEKLYIQYSPGNIRLLKCSNCELVLVSMDSQKTQARTKSSATASAPTITSCRRKKKDNATFLENLKDHIDEFIDASMDEHKSCFTKTIQKMFGISKVVALRSSEKQEVESILPLQTTVSK